MFVRDSVLVVDDDISVLAALAAELEDHYDVISVSSAEQAIAQLTTRNFSAIISDVRMPGVNGLSLISQCTVRYPNMVRIVLTAYDGDEVAETILGPHGAYKVLKPWGDNLIITLEAALKQREHNLELRRHLDLKSEMMDIDRRLHIKLSPESLVREAVMEMTRIPEVSAAAVYNINEDGQGSLLYNAMHAKDGFVPEFKKNRSSPIPIETGFLYSIYIEDREKPWVAVSLRLTSINIEILRYLDFVGRQAMRTLHIIRAELRSSVPSPSIVTENCVSVDWLVDELTTPVTVLAGASFSLKQLADLVENLIPEDEESQLIYSEYLELSEDLTKITKYLSKMLNQLRSQQTVVDLAESANGS